MEGSRRLEFLPAGGAGIANEWHTRLFFRKEIIVGELLVFESTQCIDKGKQMSPTLGSKSAEHVMCDVKVTRQRLNQLRMLADWQLAELGFDPISINAACRAIDEPTKEGGTQ